MKKLFIIAAVFALAVTQNSFAQDSAKPSPSAQLLSLYYNIKNALVADNANAASSSAREFVTAAKSIGNRAIPEDSLAALVKDANDIANTSDIQKQRDYFAGFSSNMATVAKTVKLTNQPVYQQYCPMKKATWLSSEKAIKNPYYGSTMPTCGQVTATLQ